MFVNADADADTKANSNADAGGSAIALPALSTCELKIAEVLIKKIPPKFKTTTPGLQANSTKLVHVHHPAHIFWHHSNCNKQDDDKGKMAA